MSALQSQDKARTTPQPLDEVREALIKRLRQVETFGYVPWLARIVIKEAADALASSPTAPPGGGETAYPALIERLKRADHALNKCDPFTVYDVEPPIGCGDVQQAVREAMALIRRLAPTTETPPVSEAVERAMEIAVAGAVYQEGDEEDECWTAEVQTVGGYSVLATLHGATKAQATERQIAYMAYLNGSPPINDAMLREALVKVRQELWVDNCLRAGRTDLDPTRFNSLPHIRIIDTALAIGLETPASEAMGVRS